MDYIKVNMNSFKQSIKKLLNFIGLDVRYYDPKLTPFSRFMPALKTFGINQVLDVGANEGQFCEHLRTSGYTGRMVSFEPLSSAYSGLQKASELDANWLIHPRCAIGDSMGNIEVNISANSVSSSVLPMLDSHKDAAPNSHYIGTDKCAIITLDSLSSEYFDISKSTLLKIDTQGYEWQVLDGAKGMLKNVHGVLIEMSLIPLYDGQKLWQDIIKRLEAEGFTLWSLQPAFEDLENSRTLQLDGLFFRQ